MTVIERIKSWSFTRWDKYVKCPHAAYLAYIMKAEQLYTPKVEKALKRGRDVHDMAEQFIRGDLADMPSELAKFADQFNEFRAIYAEDPSLLEMEEEWGFDEQWQTCDYWDKEVIWLRVKLDRLHWLDQEHTAADVVDYKTGRKWGNEVKHNQQGQLYAICSFIRYPTLQTVTVSMMYLDEGNPTKKTYTREQAMAMMPSWDNRAREMTQATVFPPRPNKINCRWCPYGPSNGTGACDYGVEV